MSSPARILACLLLPLAHALSPAAAGAEPPRRVVSINLCTDQLVMALADEHQIVALSHLSRVDGLSFLSRRAAAFRLVRGVAEEVLKLAPDLVLAGAFSSAATRSILVTQGVRVVTFAPATTIREARAEIATVAALLGHPERGARLIAEVDRALAESAPAAGRPISALQFQRRGFASGRETLVADLMSHLGIVNAADRLGLSSVERAPLEAVLKARPDMLILEEEGRHPPDQGAALLSHPVLEVAVPPARRAILPLSQITCAGPALPAAIRTLSRESARVRALIAQSGG
jgi:iron complex transport system substrate-binding protein